MRYEIYVPRLNRQKTWLRLLVESDDWAAALKSGLLRLGESGDAIEHAVCEVQPGGLFFVRDPGSQRTFLLRELPEEPAPAAAPGPQGRPASDLGPDPGLSVRATDPGLAPAARVLEELESSQLPPDTPLPKSLPQIPVSADDSERMEALRRDLEARMAGLDLQAAANLALDVAMAWVPCESGSVLYTHVNQRDLYFVAARGPKSEEVFSFLVPTGRGIVGFAAAEGTCLAVNDVRRDPRFFSRISEALGHEVRNLMAAPLLTRGKVFGAIELINRQGGHAFRGEELRQLSLVGYVLAERIAAVLKV